MHQELNKLKKLRDLTRKTASYPSSSLVGSSSLEGLVYTVTGLTGEAGEIANKLKKVLRKDPKYWEPMLCSITGEALDAITQELADVLWYVDSTAFHLGLTTGDLVAILCKKLEGRLGRGVIQGDGDAR